MGPAPCVVVPFAPGGGADVVARLLAQRLSESMEGQFVVDNRSGAGGAIGTDIVAKAAPDGYTLLVASATVLLAANATVPAQDLRSCIAAVKKGNAHHGQLVVTGTIEEAAQLSVFIEPRGAHAAAGAIGRRDPADPRRVREGGARRPPEAEGHGRDLHSFARRVLRREGDEVLR